MTIKTIFLDRDGVINKEKNFVFKTSDFEFIDGVFDACSKFEELGYQIIVITNQSGIARGLFSIKDYKILTKWMMARFKENNISILDIFHCPHGPKSTCECRKPKPGMLIQAKQKYNIDMANSWMIGDKETDIEAANLAGIKSTILTRSGHEIDEKISRAKFFTNSIKDTIKIISS